ncbi:MAG: hypothetical protein J5I98_16330 [Phaeodactylibacter sp.]|nr:hypothetical protein [Phaeodactylibacter sp.]
MRAAGIYETSISSLVAEGTVVEKGEYVASLDRTELAGKMANVQTEIEKIQTQLEQSRCIGVTNAYFHLNALSLAAGTWYHSMHLEKGAAVRPLRF